jgi:hypothetical protein
MGGQGHNPKVARSPVGAQAPERLPAIHAWERKVHQNEIELCSLGNDDAGGTITSFDNFVAGGPKQLHG